jgi:hypothetical protein
METEITGLIRAIEEQGYVINMVDRSEMQKSNRDVYAGITIKASKYIGKTKNDDVCDSIFDKASSFSDIQKYCDEGIADKHLFEGEKICIKNLSIPKVESRHIGEFEEIDATDVAVTVIKVEPSKVIFNFERILFRHCIDEDFDGDTFEETQLSKYLSGVFAEGLEKSIGIKVFDVGLLSEENVFDTSSKFFMPYFMERKNRIKTLLDDSDVWWWWTKSPYASDSAAFCNVHYYGNSDAHGAGHSGGGVAPAFAVGKK